MNHLFPGLVGIIAIVYISCTDKQYIGDLLKISTFVDVFTNRIEYKEWQPTAIFIVLSYIAGHLIAYLSSVIVEKFANTVFKYPSSYLIHVDVESEISSWKDRLRKDYNLLFSRYFCHVNNAGSMCWRMIVFVLLLPVSFPMLLLCPLFSLNRFIVRPLDEYVRNSILNKLDTLADKLHISFPDVNSDEDYHRVVMHYVYLNIPNCQRKVDNYIAMYGFLRAITLIICFFIDFLLIKQAILIFNTIKSDSLVLVFDWTMFISFCVLVLIANLLFMAFVKYYRRFTLENFMSLLTEKDD